MHDFPLIATVAAGFTAAWVLGLFTQWLRLSPIVGYLLAGVLIGPHTAWADYFQGDTHLAHQLAEVGVILLMFGVGLHFHLADLLAVKGVAIPGALGQSIAATVVSVGIFLLFGLEARTGAVIGMAMAVASTVVLMRVLLDADALNSPAGHVAVGWLLVEDVMTVMVLVMIPVLGNDVGASVEDSVWSSPLVVIAIALLKLAALITIVMLAGSKVIPWVLTQVARLRSRELFTLTVMVFSIAVAAGAYVVFGASMALGAFLAGMVVAQSPVSHQAAADALPLRDAFAVLFFVAVGMLFDPRFLLQEPLMMLAALGVILLVKPLVAMLIVAVLGYSVRTALTVALGLAQIGEFSFILTDLARKHGLLPDDPLTGQNRGYNLLVGGAILSITLNPLLFRSLDSIERWLRSYPRLWALLNSRSERDASRINVATAEQISSLDRATSRLAIVVGFGPVGQTVDRLLREAGLHTVIIDMNMDTVAELRRQGQTAIFGDASRETILESAGIIQASHLVLTLPQTTDRAAIVTLARDLNPKLKIFVRARYLREREELEQVGASAAIFEEAEAAVALARLVLADTGAGSERIENAVRDIRTRLILENVTSLRTQMVRSIMIPWARVFKLSSSASLEQVRRAVGEQHFSRWPVVDDESGLPVGYLLAKDLIANRSEGATWSELIRAFETVKPDDRIESVLTRFQREGATIGVVVDRGKSVGIITIEDILEQVIGRIEDEYPREAKVLLHRLLVTDTALLDLASETSEQAIAEMAARIPTDRLPADARVADLAIAREKQVTTDLGMGVAVPHARCPNLASAVVVFGRSSAGVAFGNPSAQRVHLIFLLLTPADQPEVQIDLLGQVANIAGNSDVVQALQTAASAEDVLQILASADQDPVVSG